MINSVNVIGAGLAGSEAALYLTKHGISVTLYEMKPIKRSAAHSSDSFCELVCNNSFCPAVLIKPLKLLYEELKTLRSEVVSIIEKTRVDDARSVAVDRRAFSKMVTDTIRENALITVIEEEVTEIPTDRPTIIATGPLTSEGLLNALKKRFIDSIEVNDANSIVLDRASIDESKLDIVSDDVFAIHLDADEYAQLEGELRFADTVESKHAEDDKILQCLPVEILAELGVLIGTEDSKLNPTKTGATATITLRRDDKLYNSMVISDFTTRMKNSAQEKVIRSIRGLENARFVRYGRLHYNTFINAPEYLNCSYEVRDDTDLYIIGQLSGIDGYLPAISSAIVAAHSIIEKNKGKMVFSFPPSTMIGTLAHYVSTKNKEKHRPMVPLFEMMENPKEKPENVFANSIAILETIMKSTN